MDRIIVASNSISNFIKFQSRICHFDQQGKEESPRKDRKKKNNYGYFSRDGVSTLSTFPVLQGGTELNESHAVIFQFNVEDSEI